MEKRILGLCLRVWTGGREDVALIYAEPSFTDLTSLLTKPDILNIVSELLWETRVDLRSESGGVKDGGRKSGGGEGREEGGLDALQVEFGNHNKPSGGSNAKLEDENQNLHNYTHHNDEPGLSEYESEDDQEKDEEDQDVLEDLLDAAVKMEQDMDVHVTLSPDTKSELEKISGSEVEKRSRPSVSCALCNESFKRKAQLKLHLERECRLRTAGENKTSPCVECDNVLLSKRDLRRHMKTDHPLFGYNCDYCDYVGPTLECKLTHVNKVHLNLKCRICRKLFQSKEAMMDHECVKPDRFQCDRCEKSYLVKAELKKHINIAHEGHKFPCDVCSDILSSSQALKRHVRNVHELTVKNFKCQFCGKSFKDRQTLQKHEKIHDDGTKSDPCPVCGKVLSSNDVLRIHIKRVHERNFKHTCEDCGKNYPYLHALQIHAEMAHLKGAALVCTVCGKEFIGKHRLRNHMVQKHPKDQEFSACEHCGKEVPVTQMRSHVVEAHKMSSYRFQCSFCPKRFDTKAHIREHIRKHTGARPYLCRGCGKYFFCRETTKKHIRLYHAEDLSLVHYDVNKDVDNPYIN